MRVDGALSNLGCVLHRLNAIRQAREYWQLAIEVEEHAPALYNLGYLAMSDELWDRAAELFNRAIQADEFTGAYFNLGIVEEHRGNYGIASRCFERFLKLSAKDDPFHYDAVQRQQDCARRAKE